MPFYRKEFDRVLTYDRLPVYALPPSSTVEQKSILGEDSKILSRYIPDFALTNTFIVDSQNEMLALEAEIGDIARRTDTDQSFILSADPPSVLSNWVRISTNIPESSIPFGGFIESPQDKTYPLFQPDQDYIIQSFRVKTLSGTCTVAIQINGVAVTGLSAVAVTPTAQFINVTALNTIANGSRVTLVVTDNSGAEDLEFTLQLS